MLAGRESTNTATDVASGMNTVVLGNRPRRTAKEGGESKVDLKDAENEEAMGEPEDIMMTENATMTTTDTVTEAETGALATNDSSDPAQLQ